MAQIPAVIQSILREHGLSFAAWHRLRKAYESIPESLPYTLAEIKQIRAELASLAGQIASLRELVFSQAPLHQHELEAWNYRRGWELSKTGSPVEIAKLIGLAKTSAYRRAARFGMGHKMKGNAEMSRLTIGQIEARIAQLQAELAARFGPDGDADIGREMQCLR